MHTIERKAPVFFLLSFSFFRTLSVDSTLIPSSLAFSIQGIWVYSFFLSFPLFKAGRYGGANKRLFEEGRRNVVTGGLETGGNREF